MGLFASRPEEPTEWAGLPSEPLEQPAADKLADASATADSLTLPGAAGVESISIPLPATPTAEPAG